MFEVAKGEKNQPYFQLVIIYFQLGLFSCTKGFLSVFKIYGNMQKYAKNTEKLVTKSFGPKAFWVLNEIISETLVWSVRTMQHEWVFKGKTYSNKHLKCDWMYRTMFTK